MGKRLCVIDIPGLSQELLGFVPSGSAFGQWLARQEVTAMTPSWPALTCSLQATLTTGVNPSTHGIVANGIATYRDSQDQAMVDTSSFAEYRRQVSFWEQSNQFIEAPRFWQDPATGQSRWKTAMLFFQNSMPGFAGTLKPAADIVITPKPEHGPDGKFTSLCWSQPADLVARLTQELGPFPLLKYWGPMAGIESSQWIARAASSVWCQDQPVLQLTYIPHLDYDLQRYGPKSPQAAKAVVDVAAALEPLVHAVLSSRDAELAVLSEYAMRPVSSFLQPNRMLAAAGLLTLRDTPDGRLIDYGRSAAFAMVDHQIAHVFVRDRASIEAVGRLYSSTPDIDVLDRAVSGHRRSGDVLLQAAPDAWFDYRWWSSGDEAPVFAKEVDIHRKPGYDPCELFFDPAIRGITQDPSRVRGSHGAVVAGEAILIGLGAAGYPAPLPAATVAELITARLASK